MTTPQTNLGGDGNGASQDVTPSANTQPAQTNGQEPVTGGKSVEELEAERKRAITEAIENRKQLDAATDENKRVSLKAKLFEAMTSGDPDSIAAAIASASKEDPETTNEILKSKFGVDTNEALINLQKQNVESSTVQALVEKKLREEEEKKTKQRVQDAEKDFFGKTTLHVNSAHFQNIMGEYETYKVQTPEQATMILDMLHRKYVGTSVEDTPGNPIMGAATSFGSSGGTGLSVGQRTPGKKREVSDAARRAMEDRYGVEQVEKFLSGNNY